MDYLGKCFSRISKQNRIYAPLAFREAVEGDGLQSLLMFEDTEKQHLFGAHETRALEALKRSPRSNANRAIKMSLDARARIVIPKSLRKGFFQGVRDFVVAGAMGEMQIWDRAVWDECGEQHQKDIEVLRAELHKS